MNQEIMTPWWESGDLKFAVGIEDTFVPQTRGLERSLDEYALTQHYDHWETDIDLIVESGATMVRWGVPWYKVNPQPNAWDWDWLDLVAQKFESSDITPIIDLMHYGTPLWLTDEFLNPRYPEYVADYARNVAERYANRWNIYTPMNEPMLNALYCGLYSYWPPYGEGDRDFVRVIRALQRGIVASQRAIRKVLAQKASFVHVEASFRFVADSTEASAEVEFLRERAFLLEDLVTGAVTPAHPMYEYLLQNGFTLDDFAWAMENTAEPDVMGVNYYPAGQTEIVSLRNPHSGGPNDLRPRINAWTEGLADVLKIFAARYRVPVFLTETSHVGTDDERMSWLNASVELVRNLRNEGLPIVGYTWWSLIDMIEWTYRYGDRPAGEYQLRMGLWSLRIDGTGDMQRLRTPLVNRFHELAMNHGSHPVGVPE